MNLPADFIDFAKKFFSNEYDNFIQSMDQPAPVSIRLNRAKIHLDTLFPPIPWTQFGYYPEERPTFTFDPLFHAGCYYVQEASSMFLEQILRQYIDKPVRMLDLCAAPGGKSTHSLSLLPEGSLLVSNEVIRNRAGILSENITKWGYPNNIVTNNDPSDFEQLPHFFDVILADVPCSGEGMFRKDPESVNQWSLNNVALCAERQQRIIADIWSSLKPGGLLIYSTCTYNTRENEENIRKFVENFGAETLPILIPPDWQISTPVAPHVYRFFPHKTKGEGFSIAALRKNDNGPIKQIKNKSHKIKQHLILDIKNRLTDPEKFQLKINNNIITAFPIDLISEYNIIETKLKIISAGIQMAEIKGKDLVPAQSSANSIQLNHEAFYSIEVNYKTALSYLHKDALVFSPDTPRSYILLKYKNIPLGFVKNVGNRANNLYPQDWRIRTGYLPDNPVEVFRFMKPH